MNLDPADVRLVVLLLPSVRRRRDLGPVGLDVLAALERLAEAVRAHEYGLAGCGTRPEGLRSPETESVAEAARRLGCSEQNVRRRLQRGTLPGWHDGRRWHVEVPT